MGLSVKFVLVNLIIIFSAIYGPVLGETGCPPEEDIAPCECTFSPNPILTCKKIYNNGILSEVFKNSERYTYQEVHIQNSSFLYVPSGIFENTAVKELYLKDSTFTALFEAPPQSDDLHTFHVENCLIQRGISGLNITNFTNLKNFYADSVRIRQLSPSFTSSLPKSLKQITLRRTETRSIREGALDDFLNLDKLVITNNMLTNISRDAFPKSFSARFIYFDDNKLNSLPDGLFSDTPNLQFLSLKNNNLNSLPETVFGPRDYSLPYLKLEGNPLNCNCLLVWIVNDKPEILGGTCETPRRLSGRELDTLRPGDFNCAK